MKGSKSDWSTHVLTNLHAGRLTGYSAAAAAAISDWFKNPSQS